MRRPSSQSGFTLLEVLVALAILGVALLMGMSLLLQAPRVQHRLDARRDAMLTAESALELIRAGAVPLQSGRLDDLAADAGMELPSGSALWMNVVPVSPAGLYEVKVEVRYKTQGQVRDVDVETMVWRP